MAAASVKNQLGKALLLGLRAVGVCGILDMTGFPLIRIFQSMTGSYIAAWIKGVFPFPVSFICVVDSDPIALITAAGCDVFVLKSR